MLGNYRFAALLVLYFALIVVDSGFCQTGTESPEAASQKSFDAVRSGRIDEFTRMMLPADLERFKKSMLVIVDMAKSKGQEEQLLQLFNVKTDDELRQLDAADFLSRLMKKTMPPDTAQMYANSTFEMLGHVMEGDDIAHCVYKLVIPDIMSKTSIASLKKVGSDWKLLLTSDQEKVLQALKARFETEPKTLLDFHIELKKVDFLGRTTKADTTYLVFRSTTNFAGAPVTKVGVLPVVKTDKDWSAIDFKDKPAVELLLTKKLTEMVDIAGKLTDAIEAARAADKDSSADNDSSKKQSEDAESVDEKTDSTN